MTRTFALMLSLSACTSAVPAVTTELKPGIDVRLSRHTDLVARTQQQQPIELPFGQGQNGTELVVALMQRARAAGATAVGDLAFHMVFKRRGAYIECETKVLFGDELQRELAAAPPPAPAAAPDPDGYATDVSSFQPHEVSFVANEQELRCKQVAVEDRDVQRRYDSRFDAEVGRQSDSIPLDTTMHAEQREACAPEHVTRNVTRFDYQAKLAYVPPDWSYLAPTYAHEPIFESPPQCFAVDAAELGDHPTHRLTATIGFRGAVDQHAPLQAPSAPPETHTIWQPATLSHASR
jgi:hypothetical protein